MSEDFQKTDGALLAARYAFMPNKLRYCGGDSNAEIFEYTAHNASDAGLAEMLKEFETMFPYLRLIAQANKIADPFNYKVVEAYWLGNELLENVSMNNFYRYLVDEQKIKKKLKPELFEKVFGKIPIGAKPHHSFHVFNIPKRTGHYPVKHTIMTMDDCRITAAKIINLKSEVDEPISNSNFTKKILVQYQPLIVSENKLALGPAIDKEVWTEINNKAFVRDLNIGDWVSLHWGWVCDRLTELQAINLNKWTDYNLRLTNL